MLKVIFTWNIKPGHEQDYFAYVLREYLPGINRLGMEITDAWATVFGDQPQIQLGAVVPSKEVAQKILRSEKWDELTDVLLNYVDDFKVKFTPHKGGFQF
ncbi:MAG: hypothetical protein ACOYKC_01350 [Anaerolineaceae bacterium]|jgi:hypothetical protein